MKCALYLAAELPKQKYHISLLAHSRQVRTREFHKPDDVDKLTIDQSKAWFLSTRKQHHGCATGIRNSQRARGQLLFGCSRILGFERVLGQFRSTTDATIAIAIVSLGYKLSGSKTYKQWQVNPHHLIQQFAMPWLNKNNIIGLIVKFNNKEI